MSRIAHRAYLWAQNPKCHWCGIRTLLDPERGKTPPDNMATIDHVRDQWSAYRDDPDDVYPRTVLACYKCNHRRSIPSKAFKRMDLIDQRPLRYWNDKSGKGI